MYSNVSEDFMAKLAEPSRHFALRLKESGNILPVEVVNAKFTTGTCGDSGISVGCAFASRAEFTLRYTGIPFEGRELFVEIGLLLDDGSYEWVPFGYWTAQKPDTQSDSVTFSAVDRIAAKFDEQYSSELTYPAAISSIISELSTKTGVNITSDLQTSQQLQSPIEGVTNRSALAIIAATLLGNAWCDRNGIVKITSLKAPSANVLVNYDYVKPQPTMDEIETEINGVKVYTLADRQDDFISAGEGHMIEVSNGYMTQAVLDVVSENIIGLKYTGGTVSFMGNPLLDPSDMIYFVGGSSPRESYLVTHADENIITHLSEEFIIDNYSTFYVPCMELEQSFDGGLTTTVVAPGSFENTEKTYSTGVITSALERQAIATADAQETADNAQETADVAQETAETALENASTAQATANSAVTLANGKNKIYYQNSAPTGSGLAVGDLWFDTDGGNAIHEYKASGWVLRQLAQGSIAANSITANELAANTITANQIASNTITAAQIAANAITTTELAANAVTAAKISASAITTDKIAANAITGDKIAANTITAGDIAAGTITATQLAANSITTEKIQTNAITTDKIATDAVTANEIKSHTITATEIASHTITAAEISSKTITANELAANSVITEKISSNAITTDKISAEAITAAKIKADTITSNEIAANAITTAEIATGAVTANEIAAKAITTAKLDTGSVTADKIEAATITGDKIAADTITANNIKADTITSAEIAANAITASEIAAKAITSAKIDTGAVDAEKIAAGAITTDKLSAGAVSAEKIAANTITADQIASAAITASELAANAVTAAAINANAVTADKINAGAVTSAKIAAEAVTAAKIKVDNLSAINSNIGTITAGILKSSNYSASSGDYTTAGMIIDLNNRFIKTTKTAILADGSIKSTSVNLSGQLTATSAINVKLPGAIGTLDGSAALNFYISNNNYHYGKINARTTNSGGQGLHISSPYTGQVYIEGLLHTENIALANDCWIDVPGMIRCDQLAVDAGFRIGSYGGTAGAEGYIRLCTLSISKSYIGYPIEIRYIARSRKSVETITIKFKDVNSIDPELDSFTYSGQDSTPNAYIYKQTTSNWRVFIKKETAYSIITPISIAKADASPVVLWEGYQVNTADFPSSATQATKV